jgi:hypothetical protein
MSGRRGARPSSLPGGLSKQKRLLKISKKYTQQLRESRGGGLSKTMLFVLFTKQLLYGGWKLATTLIVFYPALK